jgi:nucleotide-binding universal stress UspA family protein
MVEEATDREGVMNEVVTQVDITDGIVVGHDGSRHAERALLWAAGWASRTGCRLHVVRTWVLSSAPRPESWRTGYVPPMSDFEQAVRDALEQDVHAADLPADLPVACHVVHGTPARRLVQASAHAELLVVSSRGRGGFAGLVMGATTDQVVRHARCPVVVIPARALDDEPAEADRIAVSG